MNTQSLDLRTMNLVEISDEEKVISNGGFVWAPFVIAAAVFVANKAYDQGHRDGRGSYCPVPSRIRRP
jgi:hypothetical protein